MASTALNKNNSAVKRIMQEARELANDPSTDYSAAPLEDDIFEWHCTIRGPAGTEFEGGLYHLRILLPSEYPFRPPSLMVLTPNGRFELNSKICISFTSYHEELWQPAWGIRTAILGIQGFFPLKGSAAVGVGSIEYPASERKRLAALSRDWVCPQCQQSCHDMLPDAHQNEEEPKPSSTADGGPDPVPSDTASATPSSESQITLTSVASAPDEQSSSFETSTSAAANEAVVRPVPVAIRPKASAPRQFVPVHDEKPPLLLDGAICVLLLLVFALICRRVY